MANSQRTDTRMTKQCRKATRGRVVSRVRSGLMLCLTASLALGGNICPIRAADSPTRSSIVIELVDGTRINADRVEQYGDTGEWTATIERSGVHLSRRLHKSEIRSINPREQSLPGSIAITRAHDEPVTKDFGNSATNAAFTSGSIPSAVEPVQMSRRGSEADYCPQPTYPGRIIGVRDDPLSAYSDSVRRAFPQGVPLSEVEFALELMRSEKVRDVLTPPFLQDSNNPGNGSHDDPAPSGSDAVPRQPVEMPPVPALEPQARRSRVDGVLVEVRPVSSEGRSDWDSLLLEIQAVDELGRAIPVSGTLQATLWGREQQLVRTAGESILEEYGEVTKLAEWTRNLQSTTQNVVASNGNTTSSAKFVVPLSRPLPDHNLQLAPFGDLHVRLLVPGEGVFEATQSDVPLRKLSLVRARNVIERGSVILPGESTTDNPSARGSLRFEQPTSGPDRGILTIEP